MAEWAERLGGLDGEQIARGLQTWHGDWPPNVEQFLAACQGAAKGLSHNTAAYKRFPRALPKPKTADPGIAKGALAEMRRVMSGEQH